MYFKLLLYRPTLDVVLNGSFMMNRKAISAALSLQVIAQPEDHKRKSCHQ